ncbi:MAG TPA: type VI secretion system baseplate subunit TssF [Pyrinomonadaceae bacterium]|nr:type VI secretion system baseplate subunit TssF [Pyrinomonadaceae bacterium]
MISNSQEELLRYYKTELTYLRRMGGLFAERYPKIAKRLELGRDECADPHVERLIESFAFLVARLQHEMDSEFPDITSALLGILYPQLTNPTPSMAIAQFRVDPEQGKMMTKGFPIAEKTPLYADARDGVTCRFRSCYPVTLWPIKVTQAVFESTRQSNFLDADHDAVTALRLRLECLGPDNKLQDVELDRLRFYLNGDSLSVTALYELLFCNVLDVAIQPVGTGPDDAPLPKYLERGSIKPVGLELDDDVLPYPPNAHPGYMLLQEYFAFPEQYFFFDLYFNRKYRQRGAKPTLGDFLDPQKTTNSLDIYILLNRKPPVNLVVDKNSFVLGCTPIINLFEKTTEPIRLDHRMLEYPLVPDKRRERTTEIHSVVSVSASSNAADTSQRLEPFYSYNHRTEERDQKSFWHARRVASPRKDFRGTEMVLSFIDLDFNPELPAKQTAYAHTLCTNRELASELPAGAALRIEEPGTPLDPKRPVVCLGKPSPPLSPPTGGQTTWRLVSHLSLNHLSLSEEKDSLAALKEILRLYCQPGNRFHEQLIEGISQMTCRKTMRHVGVEPWRGFCRGTEVTLTFDEDFYEGSGAFLFSAVLNGFLASHASVNSFTQLIVKSKQREGIWKTWDPMPGEQVIL